jgi:hypothetical protein
MSVCVAALSESGVAITVSAFLTVGSSFRPPRPLLFTVRLCSSRVVAARFRLITSNSYWRIAHEKSPRSEMLLTVATSSSVWLTISQSFTLRQPATPR